MSKLTWHKIETELKQDIPTLSRRDKESFWQEFEAKASEVSQEIVPDTRPMLLLMNGWMKVAASILLIGSIALFTITRDSDVSLAQNKVKNLEVFASYSAMIILGDSNSKGTIVWITDLESTEK